MRRVPRCVSLALSALLVGLLTAGSAAASQRASGGLSATVHLRGTVYSFDSQDPIPGATVRVAELPRITATSRADGSYELTVPDGTRVTPYVAAGGYHEIFLQTFVTAGHDLNRVNFQIPTTGTYAALAALLGVALDADGNAVRCAIVSTFSTVNVRDLGFDDFVAYGAHGVADATANTNPALPSPIYFNSLVIPDRSQAVSSNDGGVIWTEVPAGVYRVRGRSPTTRFADFTAECEPGRLVNANPPWGLRELRPDETDDDAVSASVSRVRFDRVRSHRVLRLRTGSSEYVSVDAVIRRRGHEVVATPDPNPIGEFAAGSRRLSLRMPDRPVRGSVRLRVSFTDATGNRLTERTRLHLPGPR